MTKNTKKNTTTVGSKAKSAGKFIGTVLFETMIVMTECSGYDSDVEAAKSAMDEFYRTDRIYNIYRYKINYPKSYKELLNKCTSTFNKLDGEQQQKLIKKLNNNGEDGEWKVQEYINTIRELKNNDGRRFGRI